MAASTSTAAHAQVALNMSRKMYASGLSLYDTEISDCVTACGSDESGNRQQYLHGGGRKYLLDIHNHLLYLINYHMQYIWIHINDRLLIITCFNLRDYLSDTHLVSVAPYLGTNGYCCGQHAWPLPRQPSVPCCASLSRDHHHHGHVSHPSVTSLQVSEHYWLHNRLSLSLPLLKTCKSYIIFLKLYKLQKPPMFPLH